MSAQPTMPNGLIVVFAKAPKAGLAKTRLIPKLGAEGAARLAQRMLEWTLTEAAAAPGAQVQLCATPPWHDDAWRCVALPDAIAIADQGDGTLGDRLARAASRALAAHPFVLLIGADCPSMNRARPQSAIERLKENDAVMHPTSDGGYALLGLRRTHTSLFDDIAWSTNVVAASTLARIRNLGWSLHIGATLHDIDEPGDLERVPADWRDDR